MSNRDQQASPGPRRRAPLGLPYKVMTISWWDLVQAVWPMVLIGVAAVLLTVRFVHPAPPDALTIGSGPKGSQFARVAFRYRRILARDGIRLNIIETGGSQDNLKRLSDPGSHMDIGLVQSGLPTDGAAADLVSLGSMYYEPLLVFYRAPQPLRRLSELAARRIAIGPPGSGVRPLALALLQANGIEPGGTTGLLDLEGDAARSALIHHQVDAIFLSGDSASPATIRDMLHTEGVRLFDFERADAYIRRFPYLSRIVVPPGAFDLGEDLPTTAVNLLAPTVELVAHSNLHPALIDLLIAAATEVHGRATLLQPAGQFPNPSTSSFPLSDEAARYYKSGDKSFLYRILPFWLATIVSRLLVVLVPAFVVIIPGLRVLPQIYNWRINKRIHRRYGELMAVERESLQHLSEERRAALLQRLRQIELSLISRKMPGSHAEQVFQLRERIGFVRDILTRAEARAGSSAPLDRPA
ncbi:MAG TPA: TAXI family TRAP transporter solute-binding subunit [Steroidobacteraceae bacterium]|nr:TAXI family TRAP transporter solute-binding subunit [Steroidobacteraceae bacterium]